MVIRIGLSQQLNLLKLHRTNAVPELGVVRPCPDPHINPQEIQPPILVHPDLHKKTPLPKPFLSGFGLLVYREVSDTS